jgi:hypothetical protein
MHRDDGSFEVKNLKGGCCGAAGIDDDGKSIVKQREWSLSNIWLRRERSLGFVLSLSVVGLAEAAKATPFLFHLDL